MLEETTPRGSQIAQDLEILDQRGIGRRRLLGLVGAAGSLAMLGGAALAQDQCTSFARETNGPFPADGTVGSRHGVLNALSDAGIVRRNLLADLDDPDRVAEGVRTELVLQLVDVNNACAPLAGHAVYAWHCDADGDYSLYNAPDRSWLRGVQQSDENGIVRFTTLFPGCYPGRYPHIHFEVFSSLDSATSGRNARLISQLAMPGAACRAVYETPRYAGSVRAFARMNSIERDGVFGNNGSERIAAMTLHGRGSPAGGYELSTVVGLVS